MKSRDALAQLSRLLEKLPRHVHAILATRRSLPLRLHKLRLAGDLAELRTEDFRFTPQETRELLEASGIALSDAGAAKLHERTEGWAAGLRLAALSVPGSPDPERFVAEFSGSSRAVAEYLLAEMLESQPADVQQLLLRTSLLDRVNGSPADLLTGHAGSEGIPARPRGRQRVRAVTRSDLARRIGRPYRASQATLDEDLAGSAEISNARAVVSLAEGDPPPPSTRFERPCPALRLSAG